MTILNVQWRLIKTVGKVAKGKVALKPREAHKSAMEVIAIAVPPRM